MLTTHSKHHQNITHITDTCRLHIPHKTNNACEYLIFYLLHFNILIKREMHVTKLQIYSMQMNELKGYAEERAICQVLADLLYWPALH